MPTVTWQWLRNLLALGDFDPGWTEYDGAT